MNRVFFIALLPLWALVAFTPSYAEAGKVNVERVITDLEYPWGFDFLPNGGIIITERDGRLRLFENGTLSKPIAGLPDIAAIGQGGLLDVALSPQFEKDQTLFLSFSEPGGGGKQHTAVARARLVGEELQDVKVIFRQRPSLGGGRHFGSRIIIREDGTLMVTLGDRGNSDLVQDTSNLIGKLVRINADGSVPADNPFVGKPGYAPEIFSIGHRNPQGAALDSQGRYWTVSHGARGGDEINRPQPGLNYGWPVISYGRHYSGLKIGEGTEKEGMEQPLYYWDPSIAPSGMTFYAGDLFPEWRGDIFIGALRGQALVRVDVENGNLTGDEERLLEDEVGRIRAVKSGPDGALWLITDDAPGGLYRLTP